MVRSDAFPVTFATLRGILERHRGTLRVVADTPVDYSLASSKLVDRTGRPLFAAAVQLKKSYVSYHLVPVYANPDLLKALSPGLRKRMQGKACFNFTTIEPVLLEELSALTRTGLKGFDKMKLPWARES